MQTVPRVVLLVAIHLPTIPEDAQIILRAVDEILYGLGHFWEVAVGRSYYSGGYIFGKSELLTQRRGPVDNNYLTS